MKEAAAMGADVKPPALPDVRIFAFGRKGYAFAAANLAASIKRWSPTTRVVMHAEMKWLDHFRPYHFKHFDKIEELPEMAYRTFGRLDPGKLKSRLWDHLPEGEHLYLDADCIALKDIAPLLLKLQGDPREYIAEVISKGSSADVLDYTPWASPAKQAAKLAAEGMSADPVFYGLQTSWAFIRKGGMDPFFARVKHNHDKVWQRSELDHKWGDSLPDELIYAFTCSELGCDPSWPRDVMFYGNKITHNTIDEIRGAYSLMTQYGRIGRGGSVRPHYLGMYDKEMLRIWNHFGERHIFKLDHIAADKYVDAYKKAS